MSEVDAVITWVDGLDSAHREKRRRFSNEVLHVKSNEETRYVDSGELKYCIASILKFAKFVRRIFIVTDNQVPSWLPELQRSSPLALQKIRVIDHKEIFSGYETYLPTFNSISIETMLYRIPGLAESWIYFNDDFFLARPVDQDFFFRDGVPRIRGEARKFYEDRSTYLLKKLNRCLFKQKRMRPGFITSQQIAARLAGNFSRYQQIGHYPHPLSRSVLEKFFTQNEKLLKRQIQHRFRHAQQFSVVALANHLLLSNRTTEAEPPAEFVYIKPAKLKLNEIKSILSNTKTDKSIRSICIQSLDECGEDVQRVILEFLDSFLGELVPSGFDDKVTR